MGSQIASLVTELSLLCFVHLIMKLDLENKSVLFHTRCFDDIWLLMTTQKLLTHRY